MFQYQQALDEFRRAGEASPLLKRMSELISLLDLTTTLGSALSPQEILDAALLIVLGELQARRGCLLVQDEPGVFRTAGGPRPARGGPGRRDPARDHERNRGPADARRGGAAPEHAFEALGIDILCPVVKSGRVIAVLGLGGRADGQPVRGGGSGASCAAWPPAPPPPSRTGSSTTS